MRCIFDHQNQQMARCSRHVLIFALAVLFFPTAVWAHTCGAGELTVEKGNIIVYSIAGHDFVSSSEIVDKGDPLVALIEPPVDPDNVDLVFKITGIGDGTTVFKIHWQAQMFNLSTISELEATCTIEVTVSG